MADRKHHQRQTRFGKDLGDLDSPELSAIGERVTYKKNQQIVIPQDGYTYRIVSGLVNLYASHKGEKNSFVIYGPGDFFSLEWMIGKLPVGTFFEAIEDCLLERYPNEKFKQLITSDATLAFKIICRLVRQNMLYKARLDNLEYQYASQRLAYRILLLGRRFGIKKENGVLLPPLSNQRMAQYVNLTRESVNREIAKFIKLKLICLEDNRICIINEQGLRLQVVSVPKDLYLDNF